MRARGTTMGKLRFVFEFAATEQESIDHFVGFPSQLIGDVDRTFGRARGVVYRQTNRQSEVERSRRRRSTGEAGGLAAGGCTTRFAEDIDFFDTPTVGDEHISV